MIWVSAISALVNCMSPNNNEDRPTTSHLKQTSEFPDADIKPLQAFAKFSYDLRRKGFHRSTRRRYVRSDVKARFTGLTHK